MPGMGVRLRPERVIDSAGIRSCRGAVRARRRGALGLSQKARVVGHEVDVVVEDVGRQVEERPSDEVEYGARRPAPLRPRSLRQATSAVKAGDGENEWKFRRGRRILDRNGRTKRGQAEEAAGSTGGAAAADAANRVAATRPSRRRGSREVVLGQTRAAVSRSHNLADRSDNVAGRNDRQAVGSGVRARPTADHLHSVCGHRARQRRV